MLNDGALVKYKRNMRVDSVCVSEGWDINVKGMLHELAYWSN